MKNWNILSDNLSVESVNLLAKEQKISPVVAVLLLNRGITSEKINTFFGSDITDLHSPYILKDVNKAVDRINNAIENKEKITIYGDYDVDGITSVAMLYKYLKSRDAVCTYYIPHRESEGYGLNKDSIRKIKDAGTSLIVTVDNGISALDEVLYAKEIGVDVVICDHHTCGESIPMAEAIVNPKRSDCEYPFKELAGAGVCFKMICALDGDSEKIMHEYGEYVALATVADVVSISGENRTLVKIGMEKIKNTEIPWLSALCEVSGIDKQNLTSYHIGFVLSPRLNAAGRMGSAYSALKLLLCDDYNRAYEIAEELNTNNNLRKDIGNEIFEQAAHMIEKGNYDDKKVIVLANEGWHSGIIGIIASKIADTYGKNVFLLSIEGDEAKGSGRGVPGLSLYEALKNCEDILTKFGGHDLAAGVSLKACDIDEFDRRINEYANCKIKGEITLSLDIDCRLSCEGSLLKLIDDISKLEPFGPDNDRPTFAVYGAKVRQVRKTRDGKHLMLKFEKCRKEFSSIGFGFGNLADKIKVGSIVNIATRLEKNEYLGEISPQFHIMDLELEG